MMDGGISNRTIVIFCVSDAVAVVVVVVSVLLVRTMVLPDCLRTQKTQKN